MNWRLVIEYDGRGFSGWQFQPGVRTVQATLEEAGRSLFGGEEVRMVAAGRTDSGVHALGQVVGFRAAKEREVSSVRTGLNCLLPPDVSVREAVPAHPAFHARFSARGKTYRYLLHDRPARSPFLAGRAWHSRYPLDWAAIEEALAFFRGRHDFSAFRGPRCEHRNPVRAIDRAEHLALGDGLHAIEIDGPGFLRYQVRIMVGTLIEVGLHKRTPRSVAAALESGRRADAGRTALPDGLYLVEVRYPAEVLVAPAWGEAASLEPLDADGEEEGED